MVPCLHWFVNINYSGFKQFAAHEDRCNVEGRSAGPLCRHSLRMQAVPGTIQQGHFGSLTSHHLSSVEGLWHRTQTTYSVPCTRMRNAIHPTSLHPTLALASPAAPPTTPNAITALIAARQIVRTIQVTPSVLSCLK